MKLTKNDAIDVEYLINEGLITSEKRTLEETEETRFKQMIRS